jgi:tRNA G18 (ribose-2'-O)-methylase SpoU
MEMTPAQMVAKQYLMALRAEKEAKKAVATAKDLLIQVYGQNNLAEAFIDGKKVQTVFKKRRNYKVSILEKLVTADLFRRVTKTSVDTDKWDEVLASGEVTKELEAEFTTYTEYTAIEVDEAVGVITMLDEAEAV